MDSILTSIKKLIGEEDDTSFDTDIIMHINSVILSLTQMGIGPETGFLITSEVEKWSDFLGDRKDLEAVKIFIYLKVRLVFDPPASAYVVEAMERQITEMEWRLNTQANKPEVVVVVEEGGITNG